MIPSVVIRFQICTFDTLNTAHSRQAVGRHSVVIRFQICTFDTLNTALGGRHSRAY